MFGRSVADLFAVRFWSLTEGGRSCACRKLAVT